MSRVWIPVHQLLEPVRICGWMLPFRLNYIPNISSFTPLGKRFVQRIEEQEVAKLVHIAQLAFLFITIKHLLKGTLAHTSQVNNLG